MDECMGLCMHLYYIHVCVCDVCACVFVVMCDVHLWPRGALELHSVMLSESQLVYAMCSKLGKRTYVENVLVCVCVCMRVVPRMLVAFRTDAEACME